MRARANSLQLPFKALKPARRVQRESHRRQEWKRLLSTSQLGGDSASDKRHPFERDYGRVVFSSYFRRLADKTQVVPFPCSDYTRTRLTHSIEAACIARSLGLRCGEYLEQQKVMPRGFTSESIAMLVTTAAVAHDLGNPPFGHGGEQAIRDWAKSNANLQGMSESERNDFVSFEGNAQTFRILSRLFAPFREGGMRPTFALCGAVSKYTCNSGQIDRRDDAIPWRKKCGYFLDDEELAKDTFQALGLVDDKGHARRHPLAFLTEAADDIAYHVIDLEDAYKAKAIDFNETVRLLRLLANAQSGSDERPKIPHDAQIECLRAAAITALVEACMAVFQKNLIAIEQGTFSSSLLKSSELADAANTIIDQTKKYAYEHQRVLQIEVAGSVALKGLLDVFGDAVLAEKPTPSQKRVVKMIPTQFKRRPAGTTNDDDIPTVWNQSPYVRLLAVTDYISGMTDSFAINLYQTLSGVRLPS